MENESIVRLPADFKVQVNYSYSQKKINESTQLHIEEIWKKELIRTRGKLFNGKILSAEVFDGKQLMGHFVEYKHYLAQARDPSLMDELGIQPICVCSYTTAGDYILMGMRADYVTDFSNYYELVPAGGIDPSAISNNNVDVIKQIKIELKEEAGIEEFLVQSIIPTFLCRCYETNTYEIITRIELDPSARHWMGERDGEYTELIWIPKNTLRAFMEMNRGKIIPLSLLILGLFS